MKHLFFLIPILVLAALFVAACDRSDVPSTTPTATSDMPRLVPGEAIALVKEYLRQAVLIRSWSCWDDAEKLEMRFDEEYAGHGIWKVTGSTDSGDFPWEFGSSPQWHVFEASGAVDSQNPRC